MDAPNASFVPALYTSLEVAKVRDTCVPPRNTYRPHELTTYDLALTADPMHRDVVHFSVYGADTGRSPGHCPVTDAGLSLLIKEREGGLRGILSDILECPRFLTCPRTGHLPISSLRDDDDRSPLFKRFLRPPSCE